MKGKQRDPGDSRRHWADEQWERHFAELVEFREKHGHTWVPARWRLNVSLGRWLAYQRQQARRGLLEPDHAKRLAELGVKWKVRRAYAWESGPVEKEWTDRAWDAHFAELVEFRERFGHTRVPGRWRENVALGRWLADQRHRAVRGLLEPERMERLLGLGAEWAVVQTQVGDLDVYLDTMLARLKAYREQYGHAGVTVERDPALAGWIIAQRAYRKAGTLMEHRKERMDAADFPWEAVDAAWEEKFAMLRRFRERFGHAHVPASWKENPPLGRWVEHQRVRHRMGKISEEQRRRLTELGFPWKIPPGNRSPVGP